jgi:hypothetical protein
MKSIEHEIVVDRAFVAGVVNQAPSGARMAVERLPFTVRIVRDDEALRKAVAIRQAAYARHMPALAEKLRAPEPLDYDQGSVVLLAESKFDGSPLGTMRIQTNRFNDLSIEQGVTLPTWLKQKRLAEATRLGVDLGRTGRVVKMMLCKAFYLYSLEAGIEWMVIGARPPVDRQYETALFTDIFPGEIIPMRHFNNIPHRVLGFEVETAAKRWADADHPLHKLMNQTRHPDIDVDEVDMSTRSHAERTAKSSARVAISA